MPAIADGRSVNKVLTSVLVPCLQSAKVLPCSHVFHASCLGAWLQTAGQQKFTCPICRANLATHFSNAQQQGSGHSALLPPTSRRMARVASQDRGMPMLESNDESLSVRLASRLFRHVTRSREGLQTDPRSGDRHGGTRERESSSRSLAPWRSIRPIPLPGFFLRPSESPHAGDSTQEAASRGPRAPSTTGRRPKTWEWPNNQAGFAASGLRSHPLVESPHQTSSHPSLSAGTSPASAEAANPAYNLERRTSRGSADATSTAAAAGYQQTGGGGELWQYICRIPTAVNRVTEHLAAACAHLQAQGLTSGQGNGNAASSRSTVRSAPFRGRAAGRDARDMTTKVCRPRDQNHQIQTRNFR